MFVTVLAVTCLYEARLGAQQRQAQQPTRPADAEATR
jgi:hypothetical protein